MRNNVKQNLKLGISNLVMCVCVVCGCVVASLRSDKRVECIYLLT